MNNPTGAADISLGTFGGVAPELDPTELVEGLSAGNQDVDFSPGNVGTRGGRANQISYAGLFVEKNTGLGKSFADAPSEAAWATPNNIALNTPGTYAQVVLNFVAGGGGAPAFDQVIPRGDSSNISTFDITSPPFAPMVPKLPNEWFFTSINGGSPLSMAPPGWVPFGLGPIFTRISSTPVTDVASWPIPSAVSASGILASFYSVGSSPTVANGNDMLVATPGFGSSNHVDIAFNNPTSAGNTILVSFQSSGSNGLDFPFSFIDTQGNIFTRVAEEFIPATVSTSRSSALYVSQNIPGGPNSLRVISSLSGGFVGSGTFEVIELTPLGNPAPSGALSEQLQATNFPFVIPTTVGVIGFQVEVSGHQTTLSPDAILTVSLINPSSASPTFTFQLPLVDGQVTVGLPTTNWGLALTPAMLNNPAFGVQIQAQAPGGELVTFDIYSVKLKVYLTPAPPVNFNWIKTYEQTDGEIDTLALDANGILWDEDVDTTPGVLNGIATTIKPNTFAKSVTFEDVEYIAFSDLSNGTDVPRLWNGQWLDRVSQVGPGAPPSVATTSSGSNITSITQHAATVLLTGAHDFLLLSASPSAQGSFGLPATPGNVLTIIPRVAFVPPTNADGTPLITVGSNIQISGFPTMNGNNPNNDPTGVARPAFYTVTSVGTPIPGMQSFDWITFQVPFTTFYNQPTPGGCTINATIATLTAAQQVPFLEVGAQFTVTGGTLAGYDNTFVVLKTPNASQLSITQTSLTSNVAQYVFTLISGTAPVVGQFVTITGTLNGNGIFNVTNAVITSASPTTFSVSLTSASNITAAPESGNGIISGTIFQFDPAGVVTNPIIGNSTGGQIATSGVLGVGTRQAVVIFQTRNGALTAPSPLVQFSITANATAIVVSHIPIGPPNVTARIIAFTGANGGNFFYIPIPVTVTSNGQQVTYNSTVVNDNFTTQVTLSFPDAVLLAATAIDVQGNNLFEQIELGSSVGFLSYSDRLIAWGEQNKIQNLINLSFDGGLGVQFTGGTAYYPLGWVVDPVNGTGGTLLVSPIFGNSYYIKNSTGGLQATYGMVTQNASVDQFQVPIITTNTTYSVRVTARCPSHVGSGNLVMDLFSPQLNQVFGSFTVPLASMGTTMNIFTGTLLTTAFSSVPNDLRFRLYATALPNGGDVEIDRVEPFPTTEPVFSTQFRASYAFNSEAFDLVTGGFGPSQNQQPIRGGMVLFDTLYALKTKSWYSTSDNGTTEPNKWTWREISNKVGTIGSRSYDYGEEWAFTACRPGVYFFNGGEPLKVSQEIQPVWDLINWVAGQSIWVRNDAEKRRLYVGVPIATPNIYMPEMPISTNPQTPNVVLMMNYRELNSGIAIADTPPMRSSFSGRLIAPEPARKWSFWNIAAPYADFIDRGNNQTPLWFCNGYSNSKLYQLLDSELDDDGAPINSYYISFGAVKPDMQDAKGLGLHRMLLAYLTMLAEGAGTMNVLVYPQSPDNLPYTLAPIPLSTFTLGDFESVVNITGERFFLRVGTNAVGAKFQLSKVTFSLTKDAWSPVRGTQVGSQ